MSASGFVASASSAGSDACSSDVAACSVASSAGASSGSAAAVSFVLSAPSASSPVFAAASSLAGASSDASAASADGPSSAGGVSSDEAASASVSEFAVSSASLAVSAGAVSPSAASAAVVSGGVSGGLAALGGRNLDRLLDRDVFAGDRHSGRGRRAGHPRRRRTARRQWRSRGVDLDARRDVGRHTCRIALGKGGPEGAPGLVDALGLSAHARERGPNLLGQHRPGRQRRQHHRHNHSTQAYNWGSSAHPLVPSIPKGSAWGSQQSP